MSINQVIPSSNLPTTKSAQVSVKDKSFSYCEQTLALKDKIEGHFLELAQRLKVIRDNVLYRPQWDTFDLFCDEMRLDESKASRLIGIYETFVDRYKFAPAQLTTIGWTTLAETLPLIKTEDEARHWLEQATHLRRQDLRKTIREYKAGEEKVCKHEETYILEICRACNERWRNEKDTISAPHPTGE